MSQTIEVDNEYFQLIEAVKAADQHREAAQNMDLSVFEAITNDPKTAHLAAHMAAATQFDVALLKLGRYIFRKQQPKV